jgi:hypothetical protein
MSAYTVSTRTTLPSTQLGKILYEEALYDDYLPIHECLDIDTFIR